MKKSINLVAIVMFVVALASLVAKVRVGGDYGFFHGL